MNYESLKNINTIIWDWNGTLLNDMDICISCMNSLLYKRKLPLLNINRYKNIFTFPVKDYYQKVGFDFQKEDFEIPATEFIQVYNTRLKEASLHQEVEEMLNFFKRRRFRQIILSAMKRPELLKSVEYTGVGKYFDFIAGINDHYAHSKLELANEAADKIGLIPDETCLIGDTIHDYEVARELGVECILVANGHQAFERLNRLNCKVVKDLGYLKELF